jgi:hypothetical protein
MRPAAALLVLLAAAAAPQLASAQDSPPKETFMLSRTPAGGTPNGPSVGGAISGDRQFAALTAFTSFASDLVPGDTNGVADVFVVKRADPLSDDLRGLPWRPAGPPQLVSRGLGGAPANGASYGADLDGDQIHDGLGGDGPHCVAFISAASNLVRGDTNGKPDAFVADLRTGKIARVSVDSRGHQMNGTTSEVEVDGSCGRVAFVSDARELALTRTGWKKAARPSAAAGLVTTASRPRRRQVYVRFLSPTETSARERDDAGLSGITFLASATGGIAGNGDSHEVALGQLGRSGDCKTGCSITSGDSVAYQSEASNLAVGDGNPRPDVYRSTFFRTYAKRRGTTTYAPPATTTTLVSATRDGRSGNAASVRPAINPNGRFVAFVTAATDVIPCVRLQAGTVCDDNGLPDIARVQLDGKKPIVSFASSSAAVGQPGDGDSDRPSVTVYGSVFYDSDAGNLQRQPAVNGLFSDRNGFRDVFFWSEQTKSVSLQSRDSDDQISLTAGDRSPDPPRSTALGASAPASSAYNNYVAFESANPVLDKTLFPDLVGDRASADAAAASNAALHQIYLRYVGRR